MILLHPFESIILVLPPFSATLPGKLIKSL